MKKINLICFDRDGTINKDENYYLGSQTNWKELVEFFPGVVEGIKLLNTIPDTYCFIITNQAGVALADQKFSLLTEKRMHEVNQYIIRLLREKGCHIEGYIACSYVDNKYVEKAKDKGRSVHAQYVQDGHPDLKPNIGMIEKAARNLHYSLKDCTVMVVGDRYSDVQMGLNADGLGILIPAYKTKELGDEAKVLAEQNKYPGRVVVANNLLEAAQQILEIIRASK